MIFLLSLSTQAQPLVCQSLFGKESVRGILSPTKNREAFLSEDQHFLKIVNIKTKTEYTFDSNEILRGSFSLDGHAWIISNFNEVQIWNYERLEGNLIRIKLRHSEDFPTTLMHKDPASGHTILKIIYRRKKINPQTFRFETVTETIHKDLETLEESRI